MGCDAFSARTARQRVVPPEDRDRTTRARASNRGAHRVAGAPTLGTAEVWRMSIPFDVITMGRIGVDIYPLQTGVGLSQVESFGKYLGGTATNVAVAASRLGRRSAVISRTGKDPFGEFLHQALTDFGVDDRWVTPVAEYPTPVTFCELFPPDHFPLYFYRYPKAPDLEIQTAELDMEAMAATRIFWMTET